MIYFCNICRKSIFCLSLVSKIRFNSFVKIYEFNSGVYIFIVHSPCPIFGYNSYIFFLGILVLFCVTILGILVSYVTFSPKII
ncbi:hypothetical protein Hanom_Chr10g00901241 [Helianthus anomalus]